MTNASTPSLAALVLVVSSLALAQPVISHWEPATSADGYGFWAQVDRIGDGGAPDDTVLTVGAQVNAVGRRGVNQIVFGIAAEALTEQGSFSRLAGLEASVVNREPNNQRRKVGIWSTFKNRPDTDYADSLSSLFLVDPSNVDSQALRIESQQGTGFERAIVLGVNSLHSSTREIQPVVLDLSEIPLETVKAWILIRYPDGYCRYYVGNGLEETRMCGTPPPTALRRHQPN